MNNIHVITCEGNEDRLVTLHERLEFGGLKDYEIVNGTLGEEIERYQKIWKHAQEKEIIYPFGTWSKCALLKNKGKNFHRIACFLSHYNILQKYKIPTIICEDDIYFKKKDIVPISLKTLPEDCFMAHWDATHIELLDKSWIINKSSGWYRIEPEKARVWCSGCYYVADPQKFVDVLDKNQSKVYDKCLIDYCHKHYPCYIWLSPSCYQDRDSFMSSIK